MCMANTYLCLVAYEQMLHLNWGAIPQTNFRCLRRLSILVNMLPHLRQMCPDFLLPKKKYWFVIRIFIQGTSTSLPLTVLFTKWVNARRREQLHKWGVIKFYFFKCSVWTLRMWYFRLSDLFVLWWQCGHFNCFVRPHSFMWRVKFPLNVYVFPQLEQVLSHFVLSKAKTHHD